MIKTKNGKTIIKGNMLEDVTDLSCIMLGLYEKYGETFILSTSKTILNVIHNKSKKDNIDKLLSSL